jgi:octaprenyl-diphosphate synthase
MEQDQLNTIKQLSSALESQQLDGLSLRLLEMKTWLMEDLLLLDQRFNEVGPVSPPNEAWMSAQYLVSKPGKRIRPLCVLLSLKMGNAAFDEKAQAIAMACELVHAATLLHDDVIDLGDERRGFPTARVIYSNSASVLGGDHLLLDALKRVRKVKDDMIYDELLEVIDQMVAGEALQLVRRGKFDPNREAYWQVVEGKTASLFRWALRSGARLGGLSEVQIDALGEIGLNLGIAFQLIDDALDLEGDQSLLGKIPFADLREGKLTWPLILASERNPLIVDHIIELLNLENQKTAEELVTQRNTTTKGKHHPLYEKLLDLIKESKAIEDTRKIARQKVDDSLAILATFPASASKTALATVFETVMSRQS